MLYNFLKKILGAFSAECYFRMHWNLYCPGCGGTRALLALVQGNVVQSVKYNPITLLFLLDVLLTTLLSMAEKSIGRYCAAKIRIIINMAFLIFIVFFSVWRNYMLCVLGIDVLGDFS